MSGVTIDTSEFKKAAKALEGSEFKSLAARSVSPALRKSVNLVRNTARREIAGRRNTGKMRDRIRTRFRGRGLNMEASVKSTGSQSNMIVGGVREHRIPDSGRRLMPLWSGRGAFRGGAGRGITGFATVVQHRGFSADPFMRRAIDKSEREIEGYIQTAANSMVRDLAEAMKR